VPDWLLIGVQAVDGGLFVTAFAVLGEMLQPKRFAGVFGASPAVALANLLVIALVEGDAAARSSADGMIVGAAAFVVACLAAIPAVRRWGAVRRLRFRWWARLVSAPGWACPRGAAPVSRSPETALMTVGGCSPFTSGRCGRYAPTLSSCGSFLVPTYRSWPGWSRWRPEDVPVA
jgi:hypothetical protein